MQQITKNCHYISRFLTKPWEEDDRRLWYYDFDHDGFQRTSSKKLFAADGLNAPEVEAWLGRMVEDPLGKARPKLAAGDPDALEDWRFYRAAALMLWLQGARSKSIRNEEDRRELEALAKLDDSEIGRFQDSCRLNHNHAADRIALSFSLLFCGLSRTTSVRFHWRGVRDQRLGWRRRARS